MTGPNWLIALKSGWIWSAIFSSRFIGGDRKRVVADRFRPASLHHFWDTEWVTRLGVPLEAADERR
jgi:hypothetical protein